LKVYISPDDAPFAPILISKLIPTNFTPLRNLSGTLIHGIQDSEQVVVKFINRNDKQQVKYVLKYIEDNPTHKWNKNVRSDCVKCYGELTTMDKFPFHAFVFEYISGSNLLEAMKYPFHQKITALALATESIQHLNTFKYEHGNLNPKKILVIIFLTF
jgi:hypothetical protein